MSSSYAVTSAVCESCRLDIFALPEDPRLRDRSEVMVRCFAVGAEESASLLFICVRFELVVINLCTEVEVFVAFLGGPAVGFVSAGTATVPALKEGASLLFICVRFGLVVINLCTEVEVFVAFLSDPAVRFVSAGIPTVPALEEGAPLLFIGVRFGLVVINLCTEVEVFVAFLDAPVRFVSAGAPTVAALEDAVASIYEATRPSESKVNYRRIFKTIDYLASVPPTVLP